MYSRQGTYLAACMHFLAIYGEGTTVVGNSYNGGLNTNEARRIQVRISILTEKCILKQKKTLQLILTCYVFVVTTTQLSHFRRSQKQFGTTETIGIILLMRTALSRCVDFLLLEFEYDQVL